MASLIRKEDYQNQVNLKNKEIKAKLKRDEHFRNRKHKRLSNKKTADNDNFNLDNIDFIDKNNLERYSSNNSNNNSNSNSINADLNPNINNKDRNNYIYHDSDKPLHNQIKILYINSKEKLNKLNSSFNNINNSNSNINNNNIAQNYNINNKEKVVNLYNFKEREDMVNYLINSKLKNYEKVLSSSRVIDKLESSIILNDKSNKSFNCYKRINISNSNISNDISNDNNK